jgi:PST family polysaccharide transporter
MTLIKTSILSFVSTVVRMIAGLAINKAAAIYIGPSGLALIGQFQNFTQLIMTLAQGAINSGVTKYTAEYSNDSNKLSILFSTSIKISLFFSILTGLVVILLSNQLSTYFFKSYNYGYIFVIFGFTIVLFVFNNLLLSIINGLKEIRTFFLLSVINGIYSLVFTTSLIILLGLDGALIALVTNQSIIFLVTLWFIRKHNIIRYSNFNQKFSTPDARKLFKYSTLAILSSVLYQGYFLFTRELLIQTNGLELSGLWQGMVFISLTYCGIFFSIFSTYYLPKLSETNERNLLFSELRHGLYLFIPILVILIAAVYILRDFIIITLFTKEFSPMRELFFFQLAGDFLKIISFLFSTILAAKAKIRIAVYSEIFFYSISFITTYYFIVNYGVIGATYAHFLNYTLFFIFSVWIFFRVSNEYKQ